jgi:hypothetical protein
MIWDANDVQLPVDGDVVTFISRCTSPTFVGMKEMWCTLRFLNSEHLSSFLDEAGLVVIEQHGFWDRSPLTETSPEIITVGGRS